MAHSMIVAAWHMLSTGESYDDLGSDYFDKRRSPQAETRRRLTSTQ